MRYFLLSLIFIASLSGFLFLFRSLPGRNAEVILQSLTPSNIQEDRQKVLPLATTKPQGSIPARLVIPKIDVDVVVEQVGLDSQKRMDIPKNVNNAAWYNLGFKVGDKGSAVIDGHLDKADGSPSVFWDLGKLQKGDQIQVIGQEGRKYIFKVSDVKVYPFDQLPLESIFNSQDKPRLNLITCGGNWDSANHNYSNRIVVYSEED